MKSFEEYKNERVVRDLAEAIVASGINADELFDSILSLAEQAVATGKEGEEMYVEFLTGLGGAMKRGLGMAGGAAMRGAQAVGGALQRGAQAVGGAVQRGAQAVGRGAAYVGQELGNAYQQAEQGKKLQQVQSQLAGIQQSLQQMGFTAPRVTQAFQQLTNALQQAATNIQGNASLRFGQPGVFGARNTAAPATP